MGEKMSRLDITNKPTWDRKQHARERDSTNNLLLCGKYLSFWFQSAENQAFGDSVCSNLKKVQLSLWKLKNGKAKTFSTSAAEISLGEDMEKFKEVSNDIHPPLREH